jgi:Fasciclin domain
VGLAASRLGDDRDGLTVLVPTDEAFGRLEAVVREALAQGELVDAERYWLLGIHEVHRLFPSSEFSAGSVGSWEGNVEMTVDPLTYGGQPILQTDLQVANGYIHVSVALSYRPSSSRPPTAEGQYRRPGSDLRVVIPSCHGSVQRLRDVLDLEHLFE